MPEPFTQERWTQTLRGIGVQAHWAIGEFENLARAYSEPGRHYHSTSHIAACLQQLDQYRALAQHPLEIELALWFHDAVYDTRRNDNEVRSAEWAEAFLAKAGIEEGVIHRIAHMILMTKEHQPLKGDPALMVDIDLGILGASPEAFEEYDKNIRLEFEWVPLPVYRNGRRAVLESFLAREKIFYSAPIHAACEALAKENLKRKVLELA